MGIDVFEISLNNPQSHVYCPGEIVAGNITLHASQDVDLSKGFSIILYGYAFVEWTESSGNNTVLYIGHQELFKTSVIQTVNPQQTEYPFILQIPNIPSLPWSMSSKNCRVQYGVNAIIKIPWYKSGDKKAKLTFTLKSQINERLASYTRNKGYYEGLKLVSSAEVSSECCCFPFCCWYYCSKKVVKLTLSLLSAWAYPGEKVPFTLEVDNTLTERQLGNAKIQLIGTWTKKGISSAFLNDSEGVHKQLVEETIYAEEVHVTGGVNPGDLKMGIGKIEIPKDLQPSQVECNILSLQYKLKVVMDDISGFRCCADAATAEVDIVIGTKEQVE